MRICLINPVFPLSLWDFSLCRDIDGSSFPFPPLGLATLAALTSEEHEVIICDENISPLDMDMRADIVGITGYHIQKQRVYQIADSFRSRGITVAIGGPIVQRSNITECSEHADAVFFGEAEYKWPEFLRDFQSKKISALYIQEKFVDMADSPLPRFELLDLRTYSAAIMETSRGCPHSCEFCEIPIRLGKKSRAKTTEQVMAEIRSLHRLGFDSIFIIDDNFFGNRKRAVELLEEIERFVISIDYRIYFSCQFTIDISRDEDILKLLNRANFRRVFIGIETPRETSLATMKKNQNTRLNLTGAVQRIQSNNIIVWGAFIVGFDSDDKDIFQEQLEFIQTSAIPVAMVGILQAIPGTPLYERIEKEGRLIEHIVGGIRGEANSLIRTNIAPANMSYEELVSGYRYLARDLYTYDNFAKRLINAVKSGKKHGIRNNGRVGKKEILTLLRLLRYYLLSSDLRRTYMFVRVVVQTLLKNPQHLQTALMHLVAYKHLKTFYEQGTSSLSYVCDTERHDKILRASPNKTALQ